LLETNGILPAALRRLSPWVDLVSMDLKLPSATGRETWAAHEEFLRVAPEKTFTKLVLTHRTTLEEVERAAELAAGVSRDLPLYLQPATPIGDVRRPDPADLLAFLRAARARLRRVRLTPQWHPVWGLH
jgi:pyruvate-formate lyase-activating enzyme